MIKVQFGSGPNILPGWINLQENDDDITKPLNFADSSVDFIFTEHCVEHVTPHQGFRFMKECYRILKPGGVLRVIVPDVKSIWENQTKDYVDFIDGSMDRWWRAAGLTPPKHPATWQDAFETILCCHGHKAAYTPDLLVTFMNAVGFNAYQDYYGHSIHPELNNIDSHWRWMGLERCQLESVVAEGVKP